MATVGTEISRDQGNLTLLMEQIAGPRRGPQGESTIVPTRRLDFVADAVSIAGPGAGNNQLLTVICELPEGFAYRLVEATVLINDAGNGAMNWDGMGMVWVRDNAPTSTVHRIQYLQARSIGDIPWTDANLGRVYSVIPMPSGVVWRPQLPSEPIYAIGSWYNETQNDIPYEASVFVSFLEYRVEQSYMWEVNSPIPVVTR